MMMRSSTPPSVFTDARAPPSRTISTNGVSCLTGSGMQTDSTRALLCGEVGTGAIHPMTVSTMMNTTHKFSFTMTSLVDCVSDAISRHARGKNTSDAFLYYIIFMRIVKHSKYLDLI